jgi:undecaprenyl-diphosphatase
MPAELEAAALGLIQGATELLPVSSSAHVAMVPWLLGWEVASWPPERRKELEVALHFGAAVAMAPELWWAAPDTRTLVLSAAPAALAGLAFERTVERRLGGPAAIAGGLLAGALALAAADMRRASRAVAPAPAKRRGFRAARPPARVSAADALIVGLAQAAALAPGVSRTGATLAAARARGFSREDASALSFGVAGPVLGGATVLKALRLPPTHRRVAAVAATSSFAATTFALRTLGVARHRPLWPFALERAALAGGILALRYRRSR